MKRGFCARPYRESSRSDKPLSQHDIGDAHEGCDIRTGDKVVGVCVFLGILASALVDVLHDSLEAAIDFLERPLQALRVLRHLEG